MPGSFVVEIARDRVWVEGLSLTFFCLSWPQTAILPFLISMYLGHIVNFSVMSLEPLT
jgi:hypothetical protein